MGVNDFLDAKEGYYFNRCGYCKEVFTGYKNEAICPMCVNRNNDEVNKLWRFSNAK